MDNFKKYFSLNLLSLLGYIALALYLQFVFVKTTPHSCSTGYCINDLASAITFSLLYVLSRTLEPFFIILILMVIEFLLRKKYGDFKISKINIPNWLKKIHSLVFLLGNYLILCTICVCICIFIASMIGVQG